MEKIIDEYNAVKEFRACVETIVNKYQMMQADYETKLKASMLTILEDLKLEIEDTGAYEQETRGKTDFLEGLNYSLNLIQQKINDLRED